MGELRPVFGRMMIINIVIIYILQYISCLLLFLLLLLLLLLLLSFFSFLFFFFFSLTLVCHEMNSVVKKFMGFSSVCLYRHLFHL